MSRGKGSRVKTEAIHDLGDRLIAELRDDYPSGTCMGSATAQALCDRFAAFGATACRYGYRLEEAMSAGVAALQDLFDRAGGQGSDPGTALAAGASLAALATAYHEADTPNPDAGGADAPLPWLAALHRINRSATADLNLSDPTPPAAWQLWFGSHPTAPQRVALAEDWARLADAR